MPQGESTVIPDPRALAPARSEDTPEDVPEKDAFASIIPGGGPALFKPSKGRIGMR